LTDVAFFFDEAGAAFFFAAMSLVRARVCFCVLVTVKNVRRFLRSISRSRVHFQINLIYINAINYKRLEDNDTFTRTFSFCVLLLFEPFRDEGFLGLFGHSGDGRRRFGGGRRGRVLFFLSRRRRRSHGFHRGRRLVV